MGPASPPSSDRDSWCTASSGSITPDELQPGVPLAPLQIFVKTAHSETLAVTVEASETFDNVKAKLHAREGLSPNQLCLISVDSVFTSCAALSNFNIQKDIMVYTKTLDVRQA